MIVVEAPQRHHVFALAVGAPRRPCARLPPLRLVEGGKAVAVGDGIELVSDSVVFEVEAA